MCSEVLVSFFVTIVLFHVVKVLTTNNNCPLHFVTNNDTRKDPSTNRDIRSKGALLVNVLTFNCLLGGFETQANVLVPALANSMLWLDTLVNQGKSFLLLKCFFRLVNK